MTYNHSSNYSTTLLHPSQFGFLWAKELGPVVSLQIAPLETPPRSVSQTRRGRLGTIQAAIKQITLFQHSIKQER